MTHLPLSNELQELASGYVLDDLEATELAQVKQLIAENPAFLAEIRQLQSVMGTMVTSVPQMKPPTHLLDRVMAAAAVPNSPLQLDCGWAVTAGSALVGRSTGDVNQIIVNLGVWLDEIFEPLWQPPEALNLAFSARRTASTEEPTIKRGKVIELSSQDKIALLVEITPQPEQKMSVSVQLYPQSDRPYLPAHLQLSLLAESGEILRSVQARQDDNYIKLPSFTVPSGFQFSIQINLNELNCTEKFIV
jgi:hypothetical protein